MPSRRVSWEAIRPRNSAVTRSTEPVAEALRQAAELFAERHERGQRLHLLGAHGGDVDRVGDDAAGQRGGHLLGGDDPGAVLRLGGRGAEVRGDDDVLAGEDRVLGERLRRGRRRARRRRACRARARRRAASRSTSSPRAQLTSRAPSFIAAIASASIRSIVSGVFGRCRVTMSARPSSSSSSSAPSTPSSRKRSAETNLSKAIDLHLEALGALRDELADAAEADHPERLAVELGALEAGAAPSRRRPASRGPGGRCGRGRASGPACARRRRPSSIRGRWRR